MRTLALCLVIILTFACVCTGCKTVSPSLSPKGFEIYCSTPFGYNYGEGPIFERKSVKCKPRYR